MNRNVFRRYLLFLHLFILICAFHDSSLFCFQGFVAGTKIKVPDGYKAIEQVKKDDIVISISDGYYVERPVVGLFKGKVDHFYLIYIGDQIIGAAPNQKIYLSEKNEWVEVCALICGQSICTNLGILYINRIVCVDREVEVFDFTVSGDHNFCVTDYDIVAHNFLPIVLGLSWVFGAGAIEFAGLSMAAAVAGITAGLIMNSDNGKTKVKIKVSDNFNNVSTGGSPQKDPNDPEDSFFNKLKARAERIIRTERFGKLYEDPDTKLWWSKDNGNHGGPHYKVYEKIAKGFEWIYNASLKGVRIVGQHKGPVGLFIPNKNIISCL